MNDKVRNILAGIGVAGIITGFAGVTGLALSDAQVYAEKQDYITAYYNQQLESGALSDREIAKFEADNNYTGFIKDEEVLNDIQQIEESHPDNTLPFAILTGVGLAAAPLVFLDGGSLEP